MSMKELERHNILSEEEQNLSQVYVQTRFLVIFLIVPLLRTLWAS